VWAASPQGTTSPGTYLKIMTEPAKAADQLPTTDGVPYLEGAGLRYDTSRYLGSDLTARYWVVTNEQGHICLVNILNVSDDSSMVCVTAERFAKSGVGGAVTSSDGTGAEIGYTEAYLVPDSLRFVALPDGLTAVTNSLVAGDSRNQKGTLTFATADGEAHLEMQLLGAAQTR